LDTKATLRKRRALRRAALAGFVLLDRVSATLGSDEVRQILSMLSERSIARVNIGEPDGRRNLYDAVLECKEDGSWIWAPGDRETLR
jgi:hypothetical protein